MSSDLEVKCFGIIVVNLVRVICPDEVMKCCERSRNEGLDTRIILRWELKDSKAPLEDPKDPLDDIASGRMTQVEQLFGVAWTWKNISENF